jgi:hypothetical protein
VTTIEAMVTNATSEANGTESTQDAALLKVVRGQPSPEELAALVAVIAGQAAGAADEPTAPPKLSGWTERSRNMRWPGRPSAGGWRASALPR